MSAEIVALFVLAGGIAAAVVFTLVIVFMVDRAEANPRSGDAGERDEERKTESG